VVTMGDHTYRKRDIVSTLTSSDRIVRPANLSLLAAQRNRLEDLRRAKGDYVRPLEL